MRGGDMPPGVRTPKDAKKDGITTGKSIPIKGWRQSFFEQRGDAEVASGTPAPPNDTMGAPNGTDKNPLGYDELKIMKPDEDPFPGTPNSRRRLEEVLGNPIGNPSRTNIEGKMQAQEKEIDAENSEQVEQENVMQSLLTPNLVNLLKREPNEKDFITIGGYRRRVPVLTWSRVKQILQGSPNLTAIGAQEELRATIQELEKKMQSHGPGEPLIHTVNIGNQKEPRLALILLADISDWAEYNQDAIGTQLTRAFIKKANGDEILFKSNQFGLMDVMVILRENNSEVN